MMKLAWFEWMVSLVLSAGLATAALAAAPGSKTSQPPARLAVSVEPDTVEPGGRAELVLRIEPASGVKINRYPKIRLNVAGQAGLTGGGEATVGNDSPPPLDQTDANYFEQVDPVRLSLEVEASAASGRHEVQGDVVYYYCVTKSGFCAPRKDRVKFALNVR
jgi:hypothetical protein